MPRITPYSTSFISTVEQMQTDPDWDRDTNESERNENLTFELNTREVPDPYPNENLTFELNTRLESVTPITANFIFDYRYTSVWKSIKIAFFTTISPLFIIISGLIKKKIEVRI